MSLFDIILRNLKRVKNRKINYSVPVSEVYDETYQITYDDLVKFLNTSYTLRSVYNIMRSTIQSIDVEVMVDGQRDYLLSSNIDAKIGNAVADYVLLGAVKHTANLQYVDYNQNEFEFIVYNDSCASYSGRKLFEKLVILEQNDKVLTARMGADVLLTPPEGRFFTEEDINQLREVMNKKRRLAGLGGIEPVSIPLQFNKIDMDYTKYDLDSHFRRALRNLANLYAIPIEMLDNERSTYNNRRTAIVSFYNDFCLPSTYEFLEKMKLYYTRYLIEKQKEVKHIDYKISHDNQIINLDDIETKMKKVELYEKLLSLEIITKEEAAKILREELQL